MNERYFDLLVRSGMTLGTFFTAVWGSIKWYQDYNKTKLLIEKERSAGAEAIKQIRSDMEQIRKDVAENRENIVRRAEKLEEHLNDFKMKTIQFLSK